MRATSASGRRSVRLAGAGCSAGAPPATAAWRVAPVVISAYTSSISARTCGLSASRGCGSWMASWQRMRPGSLAKISTRSAIITASSMLCETTSIAWVGMVPLRQSCKMSSRSRSPVSTSSAENASSISSTSGWVTKARAMPTRWRMPPESSRGSAPSKPARPMRSMAASARTARSACGTPRASRPSSTFCCTVSHGNRANDWNTMLIARAGPCSGWPR